MRSFPVRGAACVASAAPIQQLVSGLNVRLTESLVLSGDVGEVVLLLLLPLV